MSYEEQLDLDLQSGEWIAEETSKLINEHKNCRTENCKKLIETKLQSIRGKLNYENRITKIILKG